MGLAVSAYTIPYGLCQLGYGPAGDRSGKLTVIRWSFLIFAFGTGLCGLATTLLGLDALRVVTGAAAAATFPLTLAYIGDVVPYERRQQVVGNLNAASSLGTALSAASGGIIGQFLSWRALFGLYGVLALIITATMFRNARQAAIATTAATLRPKGGWGELLRLRKAQVLFAITALEGVFVWSGFTYLGAYLSARFGVTYLIIGLVLACYGFGTVLTSSFLPIIVRRLGENGLVLWGGLLLAGSFLVLPPLGWWPLFALPMLCLGAGFALFHSTLQIRATELVPSLRGTSVALFAFSLFLGRGIGTAGLGWLVTASGYEPMILVCGLGMVGLTAVTLRFS